MGAVNMWVGAEESRMNTSLLPILGSHHQARQCSRPLSPLRRSTFTSPPKGSWRSARVPALSLIPHMRASSAYPVTGSFVSDRMIDWSGMRSKYPGRLSMIRLRVAAWKAPARSSSTFQFVKAVVCRGQHLVLDQTGVDLRPTGGWMGGCVWESSLWNCPA